MNVQPIALNVYDPSLNELFKCFSGLWCIAQGGKSVGG